MCGGKYDRFATPRQLTVIRGETLVGRTIRLLRENGAEDICISTNDPRYKQFGVPLLSHENRFHVFNGGSTGCWVEAFYPMDEPACYIMGDVYFSPRAIRTLVETDTESVQFFASAPPFDKSYIKPYAEPFAFKVRDQKRFKAAISFVKANINTGIFCRHPISWELWQVINGENVKDINFRNYIAINDYTCDIDSEKDVGRLEEVLN